MFLSNQTLIFIKKNNKKVVLKKLKIALNYSILLIILLDLIILTFQFINRELIHTQKLIVNFNKFIKIRYPIFN